MFASADFAGQECRCIEIRGSLEQLQNFDHRLRGSYDGSFLTNFLNLSVEDFLPAEHGGSVADTIERQNHFRPSQGSRQAVESTSLICFSSEKIALLVPDQDHNSLRELAGNPLNDVPPGSAVNPVVAEYDV